MISQAKFSLDELQTAVVEVEAIINSRPLSYVSSDDLEKLLTPSPLLTGRRVLSLPDQLSYNSEPDYEDFKIDSTQLNRRMKHLSNVLNHFWERWRNEYLLALRNSHRQEAVPDLPIACGYIVLVHNEHLPWGLWKLARVEEIFTERGGKVSSAVVRQSDKNHQPILLCRPLHHGAFSRLNTYLTPTVDKYSCTSPCSLSPSLLS